MTETKQEQAQRVWEEHGRRMDWPEGMAFLAVYDQARWKMTYPPEPFPAGPFPETVTVEVVHFKRIPLYQGEFRVGWIITTNDGFFVKVF